MNWIRVRNIKREDSQEQNEEEVDYVKSKMRSGLSQIFEHLRKSTSGSVLVRYGRLFAEVLHISERIRVFVESAGAN